MNQRDWLSYAAIGSLIAFVCLGSYFSPQIARGFCGGALGTAGQNVTSTPASEQNSTSDIGSSDFKRVDCDHPQGTDQEDLCEQRHMAEAAEGLLWWTKLQFWAGLFGFGGLLASLYLTRRAVIAAQDQVKLSRQAMTSTERAYITFGGCRWISHRKDDDGTIFWRVRVAWSNAGRTPTRHLRVRIAHAIADSPLPDTAPLPTPTGGPFGSLVPGGGILSGIIDIDGAELARVKSGQLFLYVWGEAIYRDVFDGTPTHVTRFFVHGANVTGDPMRGWDEKENPLGIDFMIQDRHNCADDECNDQPKT